MKASESKPLVGILMGSDSDWPTMKAAADVLRAIRHRQRSEGHFRAPRPAGFEEYASSASNAACALSSPARAARRIYRA